VTSHRLSFIKQSVSFKAIFVKKKICLQALTGLESLLSSIYPAHPSRSHLLRTGTARSRLSGHPSSQSPVRCIPTRASISRTTRWCLRPLELRSRATLQRLAVQEVRPHRSGGDNGNPARWPAIKCCHRNRAQPVLIDTGNSTFFYSLLSYSPVRGRKGYSPVLLFAAIWYHEARRPVRPAVPRGHSRRCWWGQRAGAPENFPEIDTRRCSPRWVIRQVSIRKIRNRIYLRHVTNHPPAYFNSFNILFCLYLLS